MTALIRAITIAVYERARSGGEVTPAIESLGWLFALTPALLALGFAAGLLSARLYVASVLERLTRRLRADVTPSELTAEMADALEDPSLRIVYDAIDAPGQWCDEEGRPAAAPRARAGRAVSTVRVSGRAAAIEHDELLRLEPGVVEAAATYAITALEHDWLVRELQSSLRELSESRARIVTVGAQARRRIERDLHDGAQQRLVALRAHLGLQSERLRAGAPHSADALDGLALIVDETIDEVRSIARGIYPSLLADRGLVEALRAAALGAPLAARVDAEGVGRYDPEIETTVYYACIEALQNAAKHAIGRDRRLDLAVRHRQPPLRGPRRRRGVRGRVALARRGAHEPARPPRGRRRGGDDRVRDRRRDADRRDGAGAPERTGRSRAGVRARARHARTRSDAARPLPGRAGPARPARVSRAARIALFSAANSSSVSTPRSCSAAARSRRSIGSPAAVPATATVGASTVGDSPVGAAAVARLRRRGRRRRPRRGAARRIPTERVADVEADPALAVGELALRLPAQELEAEGEDRDQDQGGQRLAQRLRRRPHEQEEHDHGEAAPRVRRLAQVRGQRAPEADGPRGRPGEPGREHARRCRRRWSRPRR